MVVFEDQEPDGVEFRLLEIGESFFCINAFIKTHRLNGYNAVRLKDGSHHTFHDSDIVYEPNEFIAVRTNVKTPRRGNELSKGK